MVEPFANEKKNIRFAQPRANLRGTFSVHWRMAQPFMVKNLNFEQKMGYGFYLPDSLMSQPLVELIVKIVKSYLCTPEDWKFHKYQKSFHCLIYVC